MKEAHITCKTEVTVTVKATFDLGGGIEKVLETYIDLDNHILRAQYGKLSLTGDIKQTRNGKLKTKYHLRDVFKPQDPSKLDALTAELEAALDVMDDYKNEDTK